MTLSDKYICISSRERCVFARGYLAICIRRLDAREKCIRQTHRVRWSSLAIWEYNPASFFLLFPYSKNWQMKEKAIYILQPYGENWCKLFILACIYESAFSEINRGIVGGIIYNNSSL